MVYYKSRWLIEVYFRTLKTGCQVEEIQLETLPRLKNCLAFYKIIAWRVVFVTHLSRERPQASCEVAFAKEEWEPTWRVLKQSSPPRRPPTLQAFTLLIAELGGYNNRPSEPPPGPQVIWLGLRRTLDFTLAWQAFQLAQQKLVYK